MSSQGVVAVEHLDEVCVNFITLDELAAIKLFGDNVKDLFISRVFDLKEVSVHGCVSGTNVVLHGCGGYRNPPCASCSGVQGTLLVEHTPGDAVAIQTDVTVANTQPNDFIARFTDHVHTQVEVFGEHFRSLELHGLDLLPENSSNHIGDCGNSENKTPHILVEFFVVNLLQNVDQSISRGEGFGEVHVKNCVGGGM